MTNQYSIAAFITVCLFAGALLIAGSYAQFAGASAPSGLKATMSSTSNPIVVAGTARVLFATSSCTARIISTASTSVMLVFGDYPLQTPTAGYGLFQAASTTVAYDSGQYGCGLVRAYPFNSGVLTITESF